MYSYFFLFTKLPVIMTPILVTTESNPGVTSAGSSYKPSTRVLHDIPCAFYEVLSLPSLMFYSITSLIGTSIDLKPQRLLVTVRPCCTRVDLLFIDFVHKWLRVSKQLMIRFSEIEMSGLERGTDLFEKFFSQGPRTRFFGGNI